MKWQYDPGLTRLARELRKRSTLGEVLLWRQLKQGQRGGHDFHRQKPIDRYIVDFFAPRLALAIELDGDSHQLKGEEDEIRQRRLESLGVHILRFSEREVRSNLDGVLAAIDAWIEARMAEMNQREGRRANTPRPAATPLDRGDSSGSTSAEARTS